MRYFIELSYKGTAYNGWQKQNNALAVQQVLEEVMTTYFRENVEITGSSRTDTGVHAEQQFAHFDLLERIMDFGKAVHSLNGMLPNDIAVQRIMEVDDAVHSRFAATHRCYEYRFVRSKSPFLTGQAVVLRNSPDVAAMNRAAALLLRYEDFESFSKIHTNVNNFRCQISEAVWVERGNLLIFRVKSNRFLRGMVRALVGTLIQVGSGRLTVEEFEKIILSRNRKNAGAQAPSEGLFLIEVGYPEGLFR